MDKKNRLNMYVWTLRSCIMRVTTFSCSSHEVDQTFQITLNIPWLIDWLINWLVLNAVSAIFQPLIGGSLIDIGSNGSSLSDLSIASFSVVLHVSQLEGVLMHFLKFMSSDAILKYEWGETMQMANFMLNIFYISPWMKHKQH